MAEPQTGKHAPWYARAEKSSCILARNRGLRTCSSSVKQAWSCRCMAMVRSAEDTYYQRHWAGSRPVAAVAAGMGRSTPRHGTRTELSVGGSSTESTVPCSLDSRSMRLVLLDEGCMPGHDLAQGRHTGPREEQTKRSHVL